MSTCLSETRAHVRVCLLPLFLPDGSQIPKGGAGNPGSLPGGRTPEPRLQREAGVSQLDAAQGCLVSEQYQGFPLRKKGKWLLVHSQLCLSRVSKDTLTDRKWAFQNLSVPQGREHGKMAASQEPLLGCLASFAPGYVPLGSWQAPGLRKQGIDLLLPSGYEGCRKPGPALASPQSQVRGS